MWVVKVSYDGSGLFYGGLSKKYNITLSGYNLSNYERKGRFHVVSVGRISGEEENIRKALRELKNYKDMIYFEKTNDFIILSLTEKKPSHAFYSPLFIYPSPIVIEKGVYTITVASWSRKEIEKLLKACEKFPNYKLISLKEERITNISITGIQPDLTDKQKRAYELAVEKGYYEYPKKITLKELAKLSKISYSTFQQHISYAEKKIGNFMLGKIPI
jgi:predicted DNA binding protein